MVLTLASPHSDQVGVPVPLPKLEDSVTHNVKRSTTEYNTHHGIPPTSRSEYQAVQQATHEVYSMYIPKIAPIREAKRVVYLGESISLFGVVQHGQKGKDAVHYPLPDTVRGAKAQLTEQNNIEIDILHQRRAFLLPSRALCDEIVESFFTWVAFVVPLINRSQFMRRYQDNENPPSLLLLQTILLAGSRVCTHPQLMDANGSTASAARKFYKRAKALYDADCEDDRVTIVQALVLMGWGGEDPEGKLDTVRHPVKSAALIPPQMS